MASPDAKHSGAPRKLRGAAVLFAVCALSAVAFAGCGSSSVVDPVAQAATSSTSAAGYRVTFSVRISSPALRSPLTSTGSGSFDTRDHRGSLSTNVDLGNTPQLSAVLGGSTLHTQEILAGSVLYLKLPAALASKLPGAKPWWKIDLARAGAAHGISGLSSLLNNPGSTDPSQMLQYLRGASGGLTKVGAARINGVATTHYRGRIQLDRVPGQVPAASRAAVRQGITALENLAHLHQIPFDVWVDGRHLVRQMRTAYGVSTPAGRSVQLATTLDIPSYGPQPAPAIPPAGQTTDLNALLGQAG